MKENPNLTSWASSHAPFRHSPCSWGAREDPGSGPSEGAGAASTAGACRWGWAASGVLPCWASGEGSCEGPRWPCCGSSCSRPGWNSSKEADCAATTERERGGTKKGISFPPWWFCDGRGRRARRLTIGGWLLLAPDDRGAPPCPMECPPDVGTGASPSSAMRDRYSLSMRALSCAD